MDEFSEDQIWDTIRDSAKEKIDYAAFSRLFPFNADNFVASMIYGFALGTSPEAIARKISVQVAMTRNFVDEPEVIDFIRESEPLLSAEIGAAQLTLKLLNDEEELQTVYNTVIAHLNPQSQQP